MTSSEFLKDTGYKHICTCEKKNQGRTYCPDDSCRPEMQQQPVQMPLPDREELIEELVDYMACLRFIEQHKEAKLIDQAIAYIQATPLTIINDKGRVLCTCSHQHADLSHHPEIAQAMQDDDAVAQELPLPTKPQFQWLADNAHKADFEQRTRVDRIIPNFKDKVRRIIKILMYN